MASLLVIYGVPADAAAFDKHYVEVHIPLAKKIPGLRNYEVSRGQVMTPAGPAPCHMVAILTFDDMPALQAALSSPEGAAAAADVQNFATGGSDVMIFDTAVV